MKKHFPRKRFGQHFLRDPQVLQNIVLAISPKKSDHFVEIGPGEGVLTRLVLPYCQQLEAIEIDKDLIVRLEQAFSQQTNFHLYQQDALKLDLSLLQKAQKLRIIGNLPYNISSPLLFHLFKQRAMIEDMHFMLQKEVVMRMTACVGSHHYNRLSVMSHYFCENIPLFEVAPQAFSPPPKVDSMIIRLIPRKRELNANNINALSDVVKIAFMHRRKTLENCLKKLISKTQLMALNINPKQRPQELDVDGFVRISNYLSR